MANDSLPLPDISAESLPDNVHGADDLHGLHDARDSRSAHDLYRADDAQDAEYEVIHAGIAATERGRWFLSEHVKRNRAADMDQLVGSLARAEAAMRGDSAVQIPEAVADDLARLAAAIGQVKGMFAAGAPSAAGGLAASERIQDVAFALRERETDPELCDALESALFELGDAFAQHDAAAERVQSAAALLRGVEANINAMIALMAESVQAEPASADAEPLVSVADAQHAPRAAEPFPSVSVSSEPAATTPFEPPPPETELIARPGTVTPSMWATVAAPEAAAIAADLSAPRALVLEDADAREVPADELRASEETAGESLHIEGAADDASSLALSEAAIVSEALPDTGSLRDETPNGAATDDALPLELSEAMVVSEPQSDAGSLRDETPSSVATDDASPLELSEAMVVGEPLPDAGSLRHEMPTSAATDDAFPLELSEAQVVSEPLPDTGSLRDETPSNAATIEQSLEESTIEPSVSVQATVEEVEPALQFHAEAADAGAPANAEGTGIVEPTETGIIAPAEDSIELPAPDALKPAWSADDDIESLLEAEPRDPLPIATQPAGAQEDLDDLFEPLPSELDVSQTAVNAAESAPRQEIFSPELPPPAFSASERPPSAFAAPATRMEAALAEPPSVPVALAPVARAIPRPSPTDPLAAMRALSEEELIALFS